MHGIDARLAASGSPDIKLKTARAVASLPTADAPVVASGETEAEGKGDGGGLNWHLADLSAVRGSSYGLQSVSLSESLSLESGLSQTSLELESLNLWTTVINK